MSGRRCFCPHTLNYLINHSSIYPNITKDGDPEYLDATGLLEKPDTHFFLYDGGGVLFWHVKDQTYHSDIYFLPRKRGAAKKSAEHALGEMFKFAEKIEAKAPSFNAPSRHFMAALGYQRTGVTPKAWPKAGIMYDIIHYELKKWAE